jgi:hypothetical protein
MYSIFHFFKHLVINKNEFNIIERLEDFPFDSNMLACKNLGQFPDLAIKLNKKNDLFDGGELIELKDSKSYIVSSFNSTIPSGKKDIDKIIKGENSIIKKQMEDAGNNIHSLPVRDVYYLLRGKNKGKIKIVLIKGDFFETVNTENLISQSFEKVLEERLYEKEISINKDIKKILVDVFSEQSNFSKVRNIDKASVKLRFRIMTEVKSEANILNPKKYPEIKDNTINLIVPKHKQEDKELTMKKFVSVFKKQEIKQFDIFDIHHLLNGYFTVFQTNI